MAPPFSPRLLAAGLAVSVSVSVVTTTQLAPFSRRDVLVTALTSGFALAVQPVAAATITTNEEGIHTAEIKVPTEKGDIPGYLARPKAGKSFPVVLVVQEIFGVHEHIKDLCRRLAQKGYLAIAPELYARQGDVSKLTSIDDIRKIVAQVPDDQVLADLDAAAAFAKKNENGDLGRLAITGFCWGGRITWLYAAHSTQLKAGVAWYGRLVGDKDPLHPQHPVDLAASLKAPVLGLYGGKDQGIPLDTVEQMRAALKAKGASKSAGKSSIHVYPEAGHAFLADYRPSYRQPDAEDGWKRLLEWFKANGVA
jgi:carboxymethylenebutenolidase